MKRSDGDLIDACSRFLAMEQEQDRLAERLAAAGEGHTAEELLAAAEKQAVEHGRLAISIMSCPASTLAELRMKARVAAALVQYGLDGSARSSEDRIIDSLAYDILALTDTKVNRGSGRLH